MVNIKKLKAQLKKKTDKHPEKYYAVKVLKKLGFERKHCKCGRYFWRKQDCPNKAVCGDCEGYTFIGKKIGKKLSYSQVAKKYAKFMDKKGYAPTDRYPVVARWRADLDFVHAAINNFQPYVVSGEVKPPANPLTVIQPSLRFNDIDNVGVTGRHYVLHGHVEQFTIQPSKKFDQEKYFRDLHEWLTQGLCIAENMIKYHEDAWGGGGNLGTSMEHFVGGLELGNQVYMNYEIKPNGKYVPLKNRVLDMGAGHERYTWIVSGEPDCYRVVMPSVCKKLYKATKLKPNKKIVKKFMPHAGELNIDETENIVAAYRNASVSDVLDRTWQKIAKKIKVPVKKLRKEIDKLSALYSVADHSRALLFALADGAIPSNTGGGYNLRSIYRRAYDFIDKYNWDISIIDVCKWHASELKPLYSELKKSLPEVEEILKIEEEKYRKTKKEAKKLVKKLKSKKGKLSDSKLVEIYDSFGITPELLKKEKLIASVPSDFYARVAERHEQKEQKAATKKEKKYDLSGVPETKQLCYTGKLKFRARVLKTFGNKVVLNKTAFYPTSGGQLHDAGTLGGKQVVDVFKQNNRVIHVLDSPLKTKTTTGKIDKDRRQLLKQHHTATHVIAGSARQVLGNHVWQAGSKVSPDHARLDITHYDNLAADEIEEIEKVANKVVKTGLKVSKKTMPKHKAEKLYGFRLYQGGAIPGSELRILKITSLDGRKQGRVRKGGKAPFEDVEACAGTHVDNTKEIEKIKITGTKKVQDGVIRLEYKAGKEAEAAKSKEVELTEKVLLALRGDESLAGELVHDLEPAALMLKTEPKHLYKTVTRFVDNLDKWGFSTDKFLKELNTWLASSKDLPLAMKKLFKTWKKERKVYKKRQAEKYKKDKKKRKG